MDGSLAAAERQDPAVDHADGLLVRAQRGDPRAFSAWIEREYTFIYRLAYRFLGQRADAEDLTHMVCVDLARKLGQFSGRGSSRGWLARVVLNASRDFRRRERPHTLSSAAAAETSETARATDRVYLTQVLAALDTIAPRSRDAVLLAAEGLTHAEIADVLDCAEGTVAWHISTARTALTARLSEEAARDRA